MSEQEQELDELVAALTEATAAGNTMLSDECDLHFQALQAITRLRRWKREATEVLAGWDKVAEEFDVGPGGRARGRYLGRSTSETVLGLARETKHFEAAFRAALTRCCDLLEMPGSPELTDVPDALAARISTFNSAITREELAYVLSKLVPADTVREFGNTMLPAGMRIKTERSRIIQCLESGQDARLTESDNPSVS